MVGIRQRVGKIGRRLFTSTRSFQTTRLELQCLTQRASNALNPEYWSRVRTLRSRDGLALNLGAGGVVREGWVNIDAFPHSANALTLDLRRGLPLRDGQVRRIFASHVVEHLDFRDDIPRVFADLLRVLEPGGTLRIVVPDARRYIEAYVSRSPSAFRELGWDLAQMPDDIYTPMHIVNHVFHQDGEHMFGYDFETLAFALRRAGFAEVVQQQHGVSLDPELAIDLEEHARYSLYVDARKKA